MRSTHPPLILQTPLISLWCVDALCRKGFWLHYCIFMTDRYNQTKGCPVRRDNMSIRPPKLFLGIACETNSLPIGSNRICCKRNHLVTQVVTPLAPTDWVKSDLL